MAINPTAAVIFIARMTRHLYWALSIGFLRLCIMFIILRELDIFCDARRPNVLNFS